MGTTILYDTNDLNIFFQTLRDMSYFFEFVRRAVYTKRWQSHNGPADTATGARGTATAAATTAAVAAAAPAAPAAVAAPAAPAAAAAIAAATATAAVHAFAE